MTSHSTLFGLALVIAFAVAAQGTTLIAGPDNPGDIPGTAGTYFRMAITPSNCTEPCHLTFAVETDYQELIFFRWDWTDDGVWDTAWHSSPVIDITFLEDFEGYACAEGWNGLHFSLFTCSGYNITNVPPKVTLSITASNATATLRIAGEKWHDVSVYLADGGNETLLGSLLREPGRPQTLSFPVAVGPASGNLRIAYTPSDDRVNGRTNGATPAWLSITLDSGQSLQMHHTFNARHPDTWNWTVGLSRSSAGNAIEFTATAVDPAPDNITFEWDFGDGSPVESATYYSLGVYPFSATDVRAHTYAVAGTYTLTLKVSDDDGGETTLTMAVQIG